MKTAPFALIKALCESVGIEPSNVAQILIDPNTVSFKVVTEVDKQPTLEDVQIPICACERK